MDAHTQDDRQVWSVGFNEPGLTCESSPRAFGSYMLARNQLMTDILEVQSGCAEDATLGTMRDSVRSMGELVTIFCAMTRADEEQEIAFVAAGYLFWIIRR